MGENMHERRKNSHLNIHKETLQTELISATQINKPAKIHVIITLINQMDADLDPFSNS